jgi:anion-transporting  ArsA/GET3 family ATPase
MTLAVELTAAVSDAVGKPLRASIRSAYGDSSYRGGGYAPALVPSLSDKRLVFVTGKGGVGKSTVAIALGIAAARRGLRTIVAELSGQARAAETFRVPGRATAGLELRLTDGLHATSVEMEHALEEYLHERAGRVGDLLTASRAFHAFASATPGMRELMTVGKAWELAQDPRRISGTTPYDLVIADAPATGHALGTLRAAATFAAIARVGPIAHQGRAIDATLRDPAQTAVVAVALAEEMPVTETLALRRGLREAIGQEPAAVVVNACLPERIGPRQARTVANALDTAGDRAVHAALRTALSEHARARAQREQVARLTAGLGATAPLELPYVFAETLDPAALGGLADRLEELL